MIAHVAAVLILVSAVSSCARRMPDGTLIPEPQISDSAFRGPQTVRMHTSYSTVGSLGLPVELERQALGELFMEAYNKGGMKGVERDVRNCYAEADDDYRHNTYMPSEFRFCVLYDALAIRTDNRRARDHHLASTPYFELGTGDIRWDRYVLKTGYGRRVELNTFLYNALPLLNPYIPMRRIEGALW